MAAPLREWRAGLAAMRDAEHAECGATRAELAASLRASLRASAALEADALGALRARHGTFRLQLAATMHGWDVLERLLDEDVRTARRRVDDALARLVLREFGVLEAVTTNAWPSFVLCPSPHQPALVTRVHTHACSPAALCAGAAICSTATQPLASSSRSGNDKRLRRRRRHSRIACAALRCA